MEITLHDTIAMKGRCQGRICALLVAVPSKSQPVNDQQRTCMSTNGTRGSARYGGQEVIGLLLVSCGGGCPISFDCSRLDVAFHPSVFFTSQFQSALIGAHSPHNDHNNNNSNNEEYYASIDQHQFVPLKVEKMHTSLCPYTRKTVSVSTLQV